MKIVTALVSVAGLAAAASANVTFQQEIDRSGYDIYGATAYSLETGEVVSRTVSQYDNLSGNDEGYFGIEGTQQIDGALEVLNFDDYSSIATNNISLEEFSFVGGVNSPGNPLTGLNQGVVFFDFFDTSGNLVDGFGVILAEGGNFIWTITINNPFEIAANGFVQMSYDDENLAGTGFTATTARWFATADDAVVGDNGVNAGFTSPDTGADLNQAFAIVGTEIPTPGAMAAFGLAGLAAARRRR